jgi:hypothetical protein
MNVAGTRGCPSRVFHQRTDGRPRAMLVCVENHILNLC